MHTCFATTFLYSSLSQNKLNWVSSFAVVECELISWGIIMVTEIDLSVMSKNNAEHASGSLGMV